MNEDLKAINLSLFHTLRAIRFLLYFDCKYGSGDDKARKLYQEFNLTNPLPRDPHIPILCRDAIIGTHASVFVWASERTVDDWKIAGLRVKPEYKIDAGDKTGAAHTCIDKVILTMRHAISHYAEKSKRNSDEPLISWRTDYLSFHSKTEGKVHFTTENGFFAFMVDVMQAVDKLLLGDMNAVR